MTNNPWLSQVATVESVTQEIDSVATYQLRLDDPRAAQRYRFQPGQFNMLYLPSCGEAAISHSGPPSHDGNRFLHTIRFVGRVTDSIAKLQAGDQIGVRGPFGSAWPMRQCVGQDVVIVTGGLGLAPLRPAIYHLLQGRVDYRRVILLYGARSPDLLLYRREMESWQQSGLEVHLTVDRADIDWDGAVGIVPLLLDRLEGLRPDQTQVLTCGPEVMMHYAALTAVRLGVPKSAIWLSVERNMQCAFGMCGHCQLGPVFVCRDGPVFRYDQVHQLLKVRDL